PDAQYSLASVYARVKRVPEAVELLRQVIQVSPGHFRANLLLGRILFLQGNPLGAVGNLKTAKRVAPDAQEGDWFILTPYDHLGDTNDPKNKRQCEPLLIIVKFPPTRVGRQSFSARTQPHVSDAQKRQPEIVT